MELISILNFICNLLVGMIAQTLHFNTLYHYLYLALHYRLVLFATIHNE